MALVCLVSPSTVGSQIPVVTHVNEEVWLEVGSEVASGLDRREVS